jgi:hypothetical protein
LEQLKKACAIRSNVCGERIACPSCNPPVSPTRSKK